MSDNTFLSSIVTDTVMSRRSFMKWSAALSGSAALFASTTDVENVFASRSEVPEADRLVWQSCMVNCGSRCPLLLHVKDGTIVRVETDKSGDDVFGESQQARSCVRGRSVRHRVYNPDRLKYPMKRVGKRGSGEFERISWEEAFDTITEKLKSVIDEYGNEAVYIQYATGALGGTVVKSWPPGSSPIARLMNCVGGYLNHYGTYSTAQIAAAMPYTYGTNVNNSIEDLVNSKLAVYFGNNPAETRMSGGGLIYSLQQFKKQSGTKLIVIDPRYSDTAVTAADEWIAIRPGTDAALISALAYVIITEEMHDQAFLDTYCIGFDREHMPEGYENEDSYKDYILGTGADATAKTPEWAAPITGIPASKIIQLAREIGMAKPAYIAQGWGPQRQANGEQNARAIAMLSIITGNVGVHGGGTGARDNSFKISMTGYPTLTNPVTTSISVFNWPDAITNPTAMTALKDGIRGKERLDVPIKFMWNYAGNCLVNQHSDSNGIAKILEDDTLCEMIVVIENHMTPSAKFADILLPDTTNFEKNDIALNGDTGNMAYVIFTEQAIEPMFECMSVYDMCVEIAKRLEVEEQFTEGRTVEDWLQFCVEETRKNNPNFPTYDELKAKGIHKVLNTSEPSVALKTFREDPVANPLTTPSGLIEIFSPRLHDMSLTWELPEGDVISGLPIYVPTWEGVSDPLRATYPLQLIGHHYKQRTHSTYGNVDWMQEAAPQEVWINPIDAQSRGIQHGDSVYVYNDRGRIQLPAKVTTRIMPGVVTVPQGAWYNPDANGVDKGGCVNTLTKYHPSPLAKGNPQHTNLVEIEKA